MSLKELQQRALQVRDEYAELNDQTGHNQWASEEFMLGFVGDVGDLAKLVMAKENLRQIDDVDKKLAHELGDCLWSLFVLSDQLGVDLEEAFTGTMEELDERLGRES